MSVLWDRIILPLIVVLGLIFILAIIVTLYGYLINIISLNRSQAKMRKTLRKQVKKQCGLLEEMVSSMFEQILGLSKMMMNDANNEYGEGNLNVKTDENGEYVELEDENNEVKKQYIYDILEETFGKDIAENYKQSKK